MSKWTPERKAQASEAAKARQEENRLRIAAGRAENAFQVTDEEREVIIKMRASNDQIREPGSGRDQKKVLLDKLDHDKFGWATVDRTWDGPRSLAHMLAEPSLVNTGQRFWTPIPGDDIINGYLGSPQLVLLRCDIRDQREKTRREEQWANARVTQGSATEVTEGGVLETESYRHKSAVTKQELINTKYPLTGKDQLGLTPADYRELNAEDAAAAK